MTVISLDQVKKRSWEQDVKSLKAMLAYIAATCEDMDMDSVIPFIDASIGALDDETKRRNGLL